MEIGQGCNTILSQVAAEELKVPMEKVHMHQLDTDVIPYDASTTSSRSTYHMGNAVRSAAIHAREQIMEAASPMLEAKVQDLDCGDGKVFLKDQPQQALPIGEVVKRKLGIHGIVRGDASYTYEIGKDLDLETGHSDHASAFYMYATQAAEVMVDEESGRVRLLRMSAAHDVGKAINPLNCVAQIEGGVAMGIGSALHEEMIIDAHRQGAQPFVSRLPSRHLARRAQDDSHHRRVRRTRRPLRRQRSRRTWSRADTGRDRQCSRRCHRRARLRLAAQTRKCLLGDPKE